MQIFKNTLTGKVALVTGGGSGIGRATTKLFGYAGARVAALGRTGDEVESALEEISGAGGEDTLKLEADVSKPEEVAAAIESLKRKWGRLDLVVANAGINGKWAPLEELSVEDWDRTMDINLRGTFVTLKYALPLLKQNGGSVVIVASVNGTRMFSNAGASAYATSKAGQVALSRMAALECARFGVRVNAVCPGAIKTSIGDNTERSHTEKLRPPVEYPKGSIPLTEGESGAAGQVAQLIWFLASDASSHITGTEVFIDGGESLLEG